MAKQPIRGAACGVYAGIALDDDRSNIAREPGDVVWIPGDDGLTSAARAHHHVRVDDVGGAGIGEQQADGAGIGSVECDEVRLRLPAQFHQAHLADRGAEDLRQGGRGDCQALALAPSVIDQQRHVSLAAIKGDQRSGVERQAAHERRPFLGFVARR